MSDCIFCKIANREVPKEFTYEDSDVMVFPDINPVKPIHLLIMPKKHIRDFSELADNSLLDKLRIVIQRMIKEQKLENRGYRLVVNGGGAQIIDHLHIHLLGPLGKAASM
ncbi:MAG: HIT domain-containing protein [Candidatus Levybacteria bacterium]|nr:HIT domain-containing protein [Candidatus Levybacteria bacterium]MBI2190079.1 HIT domain-containing protein [Candidatus Levybacteria bacterium]MBI3070088.1 HIT domain-containing protein [Candidatus Levybacteria bacterium]MBI3093204.1 HIT domain-containing protein [Candidatus Levybacteria bacterium]